MRRKIKKPKQKRFYPPTAEDFILVRRVACLSQKDVSNLLHVCHRTVKNWEIGKTKIPYAAYKLLRFLTHYELPGDCWVGWSIRNAQLFTPTGRSFRPHELYYISNMFQMARMWIAERKELRERAMRPPPPFEYQPFQPLRLIKGGF